MTNKLFSLFIFVFVVSNTSYGQSFLNGDFEINSAGGDQINIVNSQYNAFMSNSVAFGSWNSGGPNGGNMDIVTSTNYCGFSAQQGNWYVCLTGGGTDAISLKLSVPLISGNSYTISFYDRFGQPPALIVHPFLIGLSLVDTTFGTALYNAPNAVACMWSLRSFSFIAPNNGQYITAQIAAGGVSDTWCHLDNFTIQETTSLQSVQQNTSFEIFPNPATTEINIRQMVNINHKESISILNSLGQIIFTSRFTEKIDVSDLASDMYFIEIRTDNEIFYSKFLKQ